jgi:transcriptional antiterminator
MFPIAVFDYALFLFAAVIGFFYLIFKFCFISSNSGEIALLTIYFYCIIKKDTYYSSIVPHVKHRMLLNPCFHLIM